MPATSSERKQSMSPGRRREGLNSPFRALGSGSIVKKLNGIGLSFGETTPASGASGTSEGGVEIIAEVVHETRGAAPSASPPRSSPMADKDAQVFVASLLIFPERRCVWYCYPRQLSLSFVENSFRVPSQPLFSAAMLRFFS